MSYCSCDDVDLFYMAEFHSTTQKETAVEFATAIIDKRTGTTFDKEEAIAKTFDGQDESLLRISPRLYSLTSIETRDNSGDDYEALDLDDIIWAHGWVRYPQAVFPMGNDTVRITGNWGYPTVPVEIRMMCAKIAALLLNNKVGESLNERTETVAVGKMANDISIQRVLDEYRLHKIIGGVVHGRNASDEPSADLDEIEDV